MIAFAAADVVAATAAAASAASAVEMVVMVVMVERKVDRNNPR